MMRALKKRLRPVYAPVYNAIWSWLKGPKRYRYLFDVIRKERPARIMEIGTWNGARAVRMLREAARFRPAANLAYYGFDLFEDLTASHLRSEISKQPPGEVAVRQRLSVTGARIFLFKGDTREVLPRVAGNLPAMDMIFIDGGHSLETIASDWRWVQTLMDENTVVIFDDYWVDRVDAGAKATVDAIDRSLYDVAVLPVTDCFARPEGRLCIRFVRVHRRQTV